MHVGSVFSMPISWRKYISDLGDLEAPPDTTDIVPAFSDASIVTDVVACCQAVPQTMKMSPACKHWLFFRVVSTNANKRFSQRKDPRRSVQLSVIIMHISGRRGISGQFRYGGIHTLDLLSLLQSCSMGHLLNRLFVWASESNSLLTLCTPPSHRPAASSSLVSRKPMVHVCQDESTTWDLPREDQGRYSHLVHWLHERMKKNTSGDAYVEEAELLTAFSADLLTEMVHKGVLTRRDSRISINVESLRWSAGREMECGVAGTASHVSVKNIMGQAKLSVIAFLICNGWSALDCEKAPEYCGEAKIFLLKLRMPRSYFVCLACAPDVLARFGACDLDCGIQHGMKESYYKILLNGKKDDLLALAALLHGADDMLALKDADFKCLMSESDPLPDADMLALEDEPVPELTDYEQGEQDESLLDTVYLYRVGLAVLTGRPRASVDISEAKSIDMHGRKVVVHFDNCSHSSGKQRCYIACPCRHHAECFKYSVVDRPRSFLYRGQKKKR